MKTVLSHIEGVDKIKQDNTSVPSKKSHSTGKQDFLKVMSALSGKAKKTDSAASGKANSNKTDKKTVSIGDKQKAKEKESDKKVIIPFSPVVSGAKLKTVSANKEGGKTQKGGKKTSSKNIGKVKQQIQIKPKNTGKTSLVEKDSDKPAATKVVNKGSGKSKKAEQKTLSKAARKAMHQVEVIPENIDKAKAADKSISKQPAIKGSNKKAHKTNGGKLQSPPNEKLKNAVQAKLNHAHKVNSGDNLNALKSESKIASFIKKSVLKKSSLFKDGTFDVHQEKPVISTSKIKMNPKQTSKHLYPLQLAKADTFTAVESNAGKFKGSGKQTKSQSNKGSFSKSLQTGQSTGEQKSSTRSLKGVAGSALSKNSSTAKTSSKLNLKQFSPSAQLQAEKNAKDNSKSNSKKSSQNTHFSRLRMSHLTQAAGRRMFSRQVAQQVRPQQFSQQLRSAARQMSVWKHHRLRLENGKTIHIAARSSNGVLQLQLNAGNSQLAKILQHHLQEIQQHLQQQLDVDINLQFKNFSEQQQQQTEAQSFDQSNGEVDTHKRAPITDGEYLVDTQSVRYFGFNQNEWTA